MLATGSDCVSFLLRMLTGTVVVDQKIDDEIHRSAFSSLQKAVNAETLARTCASKLVSRYEYEKSRTRIGYMIVKTGTYYDCIEESVAVTCMFTCERYYWMTT